MVLFDTGAIFTYVRRGLIATAPRQPMVEPFRVALGGRTVEVRELCLICGRVEGPVDELGRADG